MKQCSIALAATALLACLVSSSAAEITCDHFNYGDGPLPLTGLNGGENWGGSWGGYDNLSPAYHPDAGLVYVGSCYSNELGCNDPEQGGTVHQSYRGAPRAFPHPLTGVIWISSLVTLGSNDSFRGFTFSNNSLTFGYGINSDCRPYIYFAGCDTVEAASQYSIYDVHLVIARVEVASAPEQPESLSVWVDPDDTCGGELGLGLPDVSLAACDVASDWSMLMFELGNGSSLDAIRVSHGPSGSLEEVLRCPASSPVEGVSWSRVKALFE